MGREDFMDLVYDELNSDPDNNRANRIIEAADEYADDSEPTLKQVELYCKRRCLTVITDEMLAKLKEDRDSIPAGAIPVAWINAEIGRLSTMGNTFADLTAHVLTTTVSKWRKEQEDKTPLTAPAPDHMLFDKAEIAAQLMMLLPEPRSKDGGEAE